MGERWKRCEGAAQFLKIGVEIDAGYAAVYEKMAEWQKILCSSSGDLASTPE